MGPPRDSSEASRTGKRTPRRESEAFHIEGSLANSNERKNEFTGVKEEPGKRRNSRQKTGMSNRTVF